MSLTRTIKGKRYRLCVAIVDETDDSGRPRKLTLMKESESVDVREHNTFITLFVSEDALAPTN